MCFASTAHHANPILNTLLIARSKIKGSDSWPPKFCKLEIRFKGDMKLAFCDARRFGRVKLLIDPASCEPVSKLGFDPLLQLPDLDEFSKLLQARSRARLKVVLLDQVRFVPRLSHAHELVSVQQYNLMPVRPPKQLVHKL